MLLGTLITYLPMIIAGTSPPIWIDLGSEREGMLLQSKEYEGYEFIWCDYMMNKKPVKSPVNIEGLPPGEYRLVD